MTRESVIHKNGLTSLSPKENRIVYYLLIALITAVALFMHLYKLGSIPRGLHIDEMAMGYNAWCIANYGVDVQLSSFPVYFDVFGGQSPMYTYLCALLIKAFGFSILVTRLPAVIFAFLTMFFGAKIIHLKSKGNQIAVLLFLSLFTILPYFKMQSRFGLDCNLMLGMSTVFLYFLVRAIQNKTTIDYIIAGALAGLVLYTYALSYLAMIIFILLSLLYLNHIRGIENKHLAVMFLLLGLVAFPLVLVQLVNIFDLPTLKIGLFTFPNLGKYRSSDISPLLFFTNIPRFFFSTLFYDDLPYNTSKTFFTMYWISIPFIFAGLFSCVKTTLLSLKQKSFCIDGIILVWFLSVFITGCLLGDNGPNANRLNSVFFALLYFLVSGLFFVFDRKFKFRRAIIILVAGIYCALTISFSVQYFSRNQILHPYFSDDYRNALHYLEDSQGSEFDEKTTYLLTNYPSYMQYLSTVQISPFEYNFPENGSIQYKNFRFHNPEVADYKANYILSDNRIVAMQELTEQGYTIFLIDHYYVCIMQSDIK